MIVNISPDLLAELARIDNVVAVKQANNDELGPIEGLAVLAGNDDIFLRTLELGGAGGILVASHLVGPQMREMWDAAEAGDLERAREIDAELRPLYEALGGDHQPDPAEGGAGDARDHPLRHSAAADGRARRSPARRHEGGARERRPGDGNAAS